MMPVHAHPGLRADVRRIGREEAPLVVIDNLAREADELVSEAARRRFEPVPRAYPGIRAAVGGDYEHFLLEALAPVLRDVFGLAGRTLRYRLCHYSLVTKRASELEPLQTIPHVDSVGTTGIATIHYLFRDDLGGTAFYRHRATGFETLDETRERQYFDLVRRELAGDDRPAPAYINGSTAHFEQIAAAEGRYNRMLVYRLNSLHSGCIGEDFEPDPNPVTGRLSINSFIEAL